MTEQTKALARVFKSRMPFLRIVLDSELEAIFMKHRLVTVDEQMIKKLEHLVKTDKNIGIFIDPEEMTTDKLPPGTDEDLKNQQIAEFLESRTATIDGGIVESTSSGMSVASSADVSGKASQALHFTQAQVKAALEAKLTK